MVVLNLAEVHCKQAWKYHREIPCKTNVIKCFKKIEAEEVRCSFQSNRGHRVKCVYVHVCVGRFKCSSEKD
jgi:hypothetical protein